METQAPFSVLPHWVQWLIIAGAVIGVMVGIIRGVPPLWGFVSKIVTTVNILVVLPSTLQRLEEKVSDIHHETHHNNGSSIKDSEQRIERQVSELVVKVGSLATSQNRMAKSQGMMRTQQRRIEEGVAGIYHLNPQLNRPAEKGKS